MIPADGNVFWMPYFKREGAKSAKILIKGPLASFAPWQLMKGYV
jgi:hypothetical protein